MSDTVRRGLVEDLFAASMDGVALLEDDVHVRVNDAYAAAFGADSADEVVGTGWRDRFPDRVVERVAALATGDQPRSATLERVSCERTDGGTFRADVRIRSSEEGVFVVVRELDSSAPGSEVRERLLTELHEAAREIQTAETAEAIAERTVEAAHEMLGWPLTAYWRYDRGEDALVPVTGRGAGIVQFTEGDPEWEVFQSGESTTLDIAEHRPDLSNDVGTAMLFPLGDHGLLGAGVTADRSFAEQELETMALLAAHAEAALIRVEQSEQLHDRQERYRQLVETGPIPIAIVTADGVMAYCNRATAEFHEADDPRELVGRDVSELMAEGEATDVARERLRRVVEEGEVIYAAERRFRQLDGTERVGIASLAPVTYGGQQAAQVMVKDITERKRHERALEESERRYRTLAEHFPNGAVVMFDGDLRFTVAGGDVLEDVGLPPDEMEGSTVREVFEQPQATRLAEAFEAALDGETTVLDLEYADREWVIHVLPVRDDDGEVFAGMAMSQDVTERREGERELRRQERLYRQLANRIPNTAVALFEPEGDDLRYTLVAGSAFEKLPLAPADLEGKLFTEVHAESYVESYYSRYWAAIEGETRSFEFTYGGGTFECHTIPFRDEDGTIVSGMAVIRDVTEQRRQERRYRTLAEHIPDGAVSMFEADEDGNLRYTIMEGPIFDEIDQDRDEAVGQRFEEYHPDWFLEEHMEKFRAALEGEASTFQYTSFNRVFRADVVPVTDDDGTVVSGMVLTQDVTDKEEHRRRLETLIDNLPGIAYRCRNEPGWPMEFVGGECEALTGYAPEVLESGEVSLGEEMVHPDDRDRVWEEVQESLDAGEPFELTYRIETADGETSWVWERGQAVDDLDGDTVALEGFTTDVTERHEKEQELERRRDELETLNRINELLLNITRALSEAPTREEVETTACERLAGSDLYRFAWVGERAIGDDAIVPRTSAGDGAEYLETLSADGRITDRGPAGTALRTGEVQVVEDVRDDESFEPWRDLAESSGYRSAAAVPLVHGETVYGVLAVYSDRPDAFSDREQSAFAILGETIGFVINAIQNRQLLVADSITELTFEVTDADALLAAASERFGTTVVLEGYAETADDDLLAYLSIDGGSPADLVEFLRERDDVGDAWVIEADEAGGRVGVRKTSPSIIQSMLAAGGTVQEATATDGTLRTTIEIPKSADVRNVVDLVGEVYSSVELVAQRERDRAVRTAAEFRESLKERLTERQLATLRAAYYAGYFDWPRGSTAEDVADSMGIASATLHHHLRKANRQLLSLFFDDADDA